MNVPQASNYKPPRANCDKFPEIRSEGCDAFMVICIKYFPSMNTLLYINFSNHLN